MSGSKWGGGKFWISETLEVIAFDFVVLLMLCRIPCPTFAPVAFPRASDSNLHLIQNSKCEEMRCAIIPLDLSALSANRSRRERQAWTITANVLPPVSILMFWEKPLRAEIADYSLVVTFYFRFVWV